MTNPGNYFDGATTPPTNYDGETTPPTAYAASNQQPTNSSKDSNRSKLIGILVTLVVVLLVLIGVLLFMFNGRDNEESAAANGSATTEQNGSPASDPAETSQHLDPFADRSKFEMLAEGLWVRNLDAEQEYEFRQALFDHIGAVAEDPSSPEVMPSEFSGVDAGNLGTFDCSFHWSDGGTGAWDCRGPYSRQAVYLGLMSWGTGKDNDRVPLAQKGTPADPLWKERVLTEFD